MRLCPFSVIAGVMASVAIWQIVQVSVFDFDASKWLTLADGLVIGLLGCIGLVLHEVSSERVTHVLEVVERPTREA